MTSHRATWAFPVGKIHFLGTCILLFLHTPARMHADTILRSFSLIYFSRLNLQRQRRHNTSERRIRMRKLDNIATRRQGTWEGRRGHQPWQGPRRRRHTTASSPNLSKFAIPLLRGTAFFTSHSSSHYMHRILDSARSFLVVFYCFFFFSYLIWVNRREKQLGVCPGCVG